MMAAIPAAIRADTKPPNIVLILADDLGYGDLGCYGSNMKTPNLDQLAKDGALFRHFSVASPVCSPSRAALLTGRYPVRTGVPSVLGPSDTTGLNPSETTIAQMLKPAGYKTMLAGKWHLGSPAQYLPTTRGFDHFYGMLCSNDQAPTLLMQDTTVIEQTVTLNTLTQRYTHQAINFINKSASSPFFLYMAHWAPHIPLVANAAFKGKSKTGVYGDVVEEMDWSVGEVLQALSANGLDQNTLVLFTSDNGPFYSGTAGPLRGRKGDTFEGGVREPFIARFPGVIPAGKDLGEFASALDLLPTIAAMTKTQLPPNVDGVDITPLLTGAANNVERPPFLYFDGYNLQCVRTGRWKFHMSRYNTPAWAPLPPEGRMNLQLLPPELYNLYEDPGECEDVAGDHPDLVEDLQQKVAAMLPGLPAEVQQAWNDTLARPVYPSTSGALPSPILP
jgi:arylsulfatase